MGMQTVNMPGGEIVLRSAARRDRLRRMGRRHRRPAPRPAASVGNTTTRRGMHEPSVIGELMINSEVWASLHAAEPGGDPRRRSTETFLRWWVKWQSKTPTRSRRCVPSMARRSSRTPPDILIAFLKAWDEIAQEESAKNPFFKKVLDSQRAYCGEGRAGQALHESAVFVRGERTTSPRKDTPRPATRAA